MPSSGYEYTIVKSPQAISYSNFTGQIPFIVKSPNRKWIRPRDCYLAVKLRIDQFIGGVHSALATAGNCTPYLSKNPVSLLFSTGKVLVNDKLISNMNELSATNTLFKSIFDTKSMQQTVDSTSPVIPQSLAVTRANYATANQGIFSTFNESTLTWALPFSLFQSSDMIPPHTKVEIDFNVNTNWFREIISCVGTFPTGGVVAMTGPTNTVANSIGVGIDDISLWVCYSTEETPVNIVKEIHLKQYFSQIHTINSSNESFTLTLPNGGRNVTHLLACFLQTTRGGVLKRSSNDFSSGYTDANPEVKITTDAVTNLQMIRFQLDKAYPNPDYDLCFNTAVADGNCRDVARMFYDMINNSNNKFDRSGNVLGIADYVIEPVMCYRVNTDATTYNETLQVYINLNTAYTAGTSQLLVVALYDEKVRLEFDSEKIINVELVS